MWGFAPFRLFGRKSGPQLLGMRLSGKPCLNPPLLISCLPLLLGPVIWELLCIPPWRYRSRPSSVSIRESLLAITMRNPFLSTPTDQMVWLDSTEASWNVQRITSSSLKRPIKSSAGATCPRRQHDPQISITCPWSHVLRVFLPLSPCFCSAWHDCRYLIPE